MYPRSIFLSSYRAQFFFYPAAPGSLSYCEVKKVSNALFVLFLEADTIGLTRLLLDYCVIISEFYTH